MYKYKLAIIGVVGVIGETIRKELEEHNLLISEYRFFDTKEQSGKIITFLGKEYEIEELTEGTFNEQFDYAIFNCESDISSKFIPIAIEHKCICIDTSNIYRMTKGIPLVVSEVNMDDVEHNEGVIACPCSIATETSIILSPLDRAYRIKRAVISTYQAVSDTELNNIRNYEISNNCIPQIGEFLEDRYTTEERQIIDETRKVLKKSNIPITATSVLVPVFNSHSMSINVEFEKEFEINGLIEVLEEADGVIVRDDIERSIYPMPIDMGKQDNVFVGRIRRDYSVKSGINLWSSCDSLNKGVASNIVQILEHVISKRNRIRL